MTEPPVDKFVMTRDRQTLDTRWHKAVLTQVKGRRGLRWKVYDYPGKTNVSHPRKEFQPEEWKEIPDASPET